MSTVDMFIDIETVWIGKIFYFCTRNLAILFKDAVNKFSLLFEKNFKTKPRCLIGFGSASIRKID